ncbi:type II secretion system minor pseudopilin GspH [Hyphococcus sp.]|jgi:general secretion pathway protein H|uniref:type II secretion system minor pseudopilin GspH n=1 Tax=Hyphococcus sp. TaxID=2038636 RepID=UPI003D12CD67
MTTGCNHNAVRRQRGFSLVELLVVMALAAMVAGIVVINAPPGRSDVRRTAERLAARLDFAAQEAVTSGALVGLRLDEEGYAFFDYQRGEWKPATSERLKTERFPAEFSVAVTRDAAAKKNEPEEKQTENETIIRPELRFLPTGETTPVTVVFQDRREIWRITLDGAGKVEVSDDGEGA